MYIPEVEAATHVALLWQPVIKVDDESVKGSGIEADADFFKVFPQYRIVEGSVEDFVGQKDVLISESFARLINKGEESLIGSVIKVNDSDRTIKGVFADFDRSFFMPANIITHISDTWAVSQIEYKFNSIGSYSTWYRIREDANSIPPLK